MTFPWLFRPPALGAVDLAVNVATSGLLRDAVEFIHAAVHVAGGRDVGEMVMFEVD